MVEVAPEGLLLHGDYLDEDGESRLLEEVDGRPWRNDLSRRVQHYGWVYDYRRRAVDPSMRIGPLPDFLESLANRVARHTGMATPPDQVIVNEYVPGQGIAKHIDCRPCFGPVVCSLSLGSAVTMVLTRRDARYPLRLPPRSLLVLRGPAREEWAHAIPPRRSDVVDGSRVLRERRISLTFRTVRLAN